jgi:hypothetical protein
VRIDNVTEMVHPEGQDYISVPLLYTNERELLEVGMEAKKRGGRR